MDFDLTEDQKEIKRVAHELLAARSPLAKVREAAESGDLRRRAVARARRARLAGHRRLRGARRPGPRHGRARGARRGARLRVRARAARSGGRDRGSAIDAAGADAQRERWLPGLASGELTAGLGTRELAADAAGADVDRAARRRRRASLLDGAARRAASTRSTRPAATRRRPATGEPASRSAPAPPSACGSVLAAEVLGVCQRALEMTLEYVKDRKQFGVPVGSFQAVSHRCAQMLLAHRERPLGDVLRRLGGGRRPRAAARGGGARGRGRGRRADARSRRARSRPTAASASPGRPTSTGSTSAAQLDVALLGGARRHRATLARLAAARVAAVPALG